MVEVVGVLFMKGYFSFIGSKPSGGGIAFSIYVHMHIM